MSKFEWDPDTFLATMLGEIPGYEELQKAVAEAACGRNVLELGTGTGETAVRILARNTGARWTGIDASAAMLERARERLPDADLRLQRLEDPLPEGPFDLVVSVLAVHHLDGPKKRDLFRRVANVSDFFVLGDLVVAEQPEDAMIEIDWVMDLPSTVSEQVEWLCETGFEVNAIYVRPDLAVFVARKSGDVGREVAGLVLSRSGELGDLAAASQEGPENGTFLTREGATRSPRDRRPLCRRSPRASRRAVLAPGSRAAELARA